MISKKIDRRLFLKTGLFAGFGLLVSPLCACSKDDDVTPNPAPNLAPIPITPRHGMDLYGAVTDTDGNPVEGVVVSDGFACVATGADGVYQMKRNAAAETVFYSTPASCAVNTAGNSVAVAAFWSKLSAATERYDFCLKRLPAPETDFNLICIGDPQVASTADVDRFKSETMNDLKAFVATQTKPCYALVLGDITADRPELLPTIRTVMGSARMPCFVTIGNHDKTGGDESTPRHAQDFCAVFGPLNYSFNRGNLHIVCLDNIVYTNRSAYTAGFTDRQVEWLRQDLSYVSKDKTIVLFYHIPLRNTASYANRTALLDELKPFADVHLMAGHTHYNENCPVTTPIAAYEHIHGAACGAWWKSVVNSDGTPNGYAVYEVAGRSFTNWFYKSTNYPAAFQIRLHKGNAFFGGDYGYYSYYQGVNIVANIWNADDDWKIEAFEDGQSAGRLTKLPTLIDAWAVGYHVGVLNRKPANYGATGSGNNKHAYLHTLKNPDARQIEIRATDRFGTEYRQSTLIGDLRTAAGY
jgi:hypothetical protein